MFKYLIYLSFVLLVVNHVQAVETGPNEEETRIIEDRINNLINEVDCENCNVGNLSGAEILTTINDHVNNNFRAIAESEKNKNILKKLGKRIKDIAELDKSFTPKNDPYYFGFITYLLKILADTGAKIDKEDIRGIISILKTQYDTKLPAFVEAALLKIKTIETSKTYRPYKGGQIVSGTKITVLSVDGEDIKIRPPTILSIGKNNSKKTVKIILFTIKNGAEMKMKEITRYSPLAKEFIKNSNSVEPDDLANLKRAKKLLKNRKIKSEMLHFSSKGISVTADVNFLVKRIKITPKNGFIIKNFKGSKSSFLNAKIVNGGKIPFPLINNKMLNI